MYHVPIAKKIFAVLQFLGVQRFEVGVSAIARVAGLSKGTTFGILAGLVREGYVPKNAPSQGSTPLVGNSFGFRN